VILCHVTQEPMRTDVFEQFLDFFTSLLEILFGFES